MEQQPVSYRREGEIGLITIDSPPVNALGHPVREGLVACLAEAEADGGAKAVVLHCAGRTFVAGADIKEFGKPPKQPSLRQVFDRFDAATKPIVAAIHGTALGGGLELALSCHWRVAVAGARVGLPEVKLGIIPGAGGTQRLPRVAGVEAALDMITSGRFVAATEAQELGIVDALVEGRDPLPGALAFARRLVSEGAAVRRVRDRDDRLAAPDALFEKARAALAKRQRGRLSPQKCVDAVEAAARLPFDEGIERERALFEDCMASPQRAALIHVFFGERAVAKVPGLDESVAPAEVKTVGVLGAGTMGGGIAMACANAGIAVALLETSQEALDHGLARMQANYDGSVKRGSLTAEQAAERMALIRPTLDFQALAAADLIIEAVFEKMEVKQEVFRRLDKVAREGAVLATNTSYLDVNRIAAETGRPQDVLGMHFFSPANIMRLLEVVRAAKTSDRALKTAIELGRRIGKLPVVAGVCDGFIGNRMLKAYQRQTYYMLEDGALPQEIDAAMTAFGMAMGPFAVSDLAGLDIGYFNRRREDATRDPAERYVAIGDRLYDLGRLGQKTGAGWYRYETGDRTPHPDPAVEELVLAASREKGIERRPIPAGEIRLRALCALANEGAKILEEGIAARAVDIDMVWVNGYGFPAHEGGPMFWADARGLKQVLADIERFAEDDPRTWQAAPLLRRLAEQDSSFKEWSESK